MSSMVYGSIYGPYILIRRNQSEIFSLLKFQPRDQIMVHSSYYDLYCSLIKARLGSEFLRFRTLVYEDHL